MYISEQFNAKTNIVYNFPTSVSNGNVYVNRKTTGCETTTKSLLVSRKFQSFPVTEVFGVTKLFNTCYANEKQLQRVVTKFATIMLQLPFSLTADLNMKAINMTQ